MKKLIVLSIASITFSCGMSPEEKLISDYEQTIENTKIDLNLKIKSINKLDDIHYSDSIPDLKDYLEKEVSKKIEYFNERAELGLDTTGNSKWIKIYQTTAEGTFLESTVQKIKELESKSDQLAGEIWEATYLINNPILGGVEQEVYNIYVLSPDKTKILRKISKD